MKRLGLSLLSLLVMFMVITMASCQKDTYEIALITDVGTIDDKSFNQGAWEGVERYALENDISYEYYQPAAKTTPAYVEAIELAIDNGAEVVVTPGFLFENAIWTVQTEYPNVKFILLDGSPHNVINWNTMETLPDSGDPDFTVEDNVLSIFYAEEESGFLAGYAAVKEGFTELGFMGGMAVPAVIRFGHGFVQGADYAAEEMDLAQDAINIRYTYLGTFNEDAAYQTRAASWFSGGIEVIFAAAGGAGNSVMKAAEQHDGDAYVIGVDVDQSPESETVITSAKKELNNSVYDALTSIYDGSFEGGRSVTFDATIDGVGLPEDFSGFETFTQAMYETIYDKVADDEIDIYGDTVEGQDDVLAFIDSESPYVVVDERD
ncbi:MAG: BMP family ABC transporter substrate-binding protein [Candidatus Izimaplasma sp.]|nr:BMP family ABC transporter substrate-binding protein [Candidatus Izimaplasma bacterium]